MAADATLAGMLAFGTKAPSPTLTTDPRAVPAILAAIRGNS
jgi:hypothetical protein